MLEIDAGGLCLKIESTSFKKEGAGGPYLEWIETKIEIEASGIRAQGAWRVMPNELIAFKQQLQLMHDSCRVGQLAVLKGVEPGFLISLEMVGQGVIVGDWRFQPDIEGAYVGGRCGLDQSFLPSMIVGVDGLLRISRANE